MVDVVNKRTRSRMMSGIKGANTKPEILVRRALHARGFRFRIHDRRLPGTPDIVLPKWRVAIQVHGCFWHRHHGCPKATTPANNFGFWQEKFAANAARDAKAARSVLQQGWRLLVIWECATARNTQDTLLEAVLAFVTAGPDAPLRYAEIGADHELTTMS
jgi:DNA mismatch endonuclease (patch repair protein)